ncbi:MAG: DUF6659 family protein [Candidatus Nitrosopumilus sp. bin_32a]
MSNQLISKMNLKSTLDIHKYLRLENKCYSLLNDKEIRFVGIINNMGNLIAGGISKNVDYLETDDERRKLYMQIALETSMRRDFDDTLGKINYVTTNRDNILMIIVPMNGYIVLISAKPTSIAEQIISKVHSLGFFQSGI